MLPDYLKFKSDAKAIAEQTVICGNVRFTAITSRLIRIEQGAFYDEASQTVLNRSFENTSIKSYEKENCLYIETEKLLILYKIGEKLSDETLQITLLDRPYTRWNYGDRAIHNLGGTVSTLDRVSGECELEDGVCSIEGYCTIDDSETALFCQDGWFKTRKCESVDLYFFGYGHDYINAVGDYCRLTGATKMLPAFALGNWWSRYHRYTQESYINLMDEFKKRDIPLSVAIVDMDWHLTRNLTDKVWENIPDEIKRKIGYDVGWTGYTWDKSLFPDYKEFLNDLHKRGLKTALNLHPAAGVRHFEEQYCEMAKAMGVNPETKQTIPFDCLDKKFIKEYFEILHFPMEKDGVDFWWMDWQQGDDYEWAHLFGIEKNELEIISPLWLLNHTHYLASMRNGSRGLIFSRFSGYGSQRFPIGFSGDTYTAWESLEFQPYFTVTASNIGYGWWSHDIGGHCGGDRDDELNTRWVQFGVFSPIFRFHSCSNKFLGREPWNYNPRAESVITDFMRLRHQLFPYLYTMNYRNFKEQIPIMIPMYYTHPEEREAYKVKNQYWFGSELIVSPITKKADSESCLGYADVWLPDGKWIDLFNGYVYNGGKSFESYRTLEQMPIFCKAGAIIPMQKHIEYDNSIGRSKHLEIVIAAGENGEFSMFEDDGISRDYETGTGVITKYILNWSDNKAEFIINPAEGDMDLVHQKREYTLIFKGFKMNCEFFVEGKSLKFEYTEDTNTYRVYIGEVETDKGIEITVESASGLLHDNSDYLRRCSQMLLHSQTTSVTRNYLYSIAEKLEQNHRRKPEPIGENRLSKAFYELAIQK